MVNLCINGDYVPDGFGGFTRLQGTQALLQRSLFKLGCKRGSFPFLPELGLSGTFTVRSAQSSCDDSGAVCTLELRE